MLGVAINQRRDWCLAYNVDAPANQREVFFGKVDDPRRVWNTAIEPWLHGMAVR